MLKVEPTGQRRRTATVIGQTGNEAVAGAASEAFTRWLHYRYAPPNCHWWWNIVSTCDILFSHIKV